MNFRIESKPSDVMSFSSINSLSFSIMFEVNIDRK